jgi:hypothetical protein
LISSALFALVMGGVYLLYTTMQTTLSRGELMSDMQQNARVGMDRMVQELRMAGNDPDGRLPLQAFLPNSALRAAGPACISVVTSSSGNSVRVSYYRYNSSLAPGGNTLGRRADTWDTGNNRFTSSSVQPLAESVAALALTFFDASNSLLTPQLITVQSDGLCPPLDPGQAAQQALLLTSADLLKVRQIGISIQARAMRPGIQPLSYTVTGHVLLRNL